MMDTKYINEIIDYLKEHGATKNDLEEIVVAAGAVTSVFGRRGAVLPQEGDYTSEMVVAAKKKHAEEHFFGGKDPIYPEKIGAAKEEHSHGNIGKDGNEDIRTVLRFHPALAPFKAAVLPLSKKLGEKAHELANELCRLDKDNEELYRKNAEDYISQLQNLDLTLKEKTEKIMKN